MNQTINNHRSRAGRMKNFFAEENSNIVPNTDILAEITKFNERLDEFDEFAERQQVPITGYAQQKKIALDDAADLVSRWGIRCHVQAKNEDLLALAELLNQTPSDITGMDDLPGLNLMKDMRNGLNDNLASFSGQGLTAPIITEISGAINSYEALINKPKEAINERKMDTQALEAYMKIIDSKLEDIVSLLQSIWSTDHQDLIAEMKNNYRIDDLGHRFTSIEGALVSDLPGTLANYKVVCKKDLPAGKTPYKKEAETNMLGEYKIPSMRAGTYEVKLFNPAGSVVKSAIIKIEQGITLDYNWTL